jgi:Uma2 family endonuclease
MSSSDATPAEPELPPVDERLAEPETRFEVHDGVLVHVPPADEPHGTLHSKVSALVEAHAAAEFDVASDMLTRTSKTNDVAPDVSVFPRARDPRTGGRQLEQLAFEIVSTQSLSGAAGKAAKLASRGVRRVFALDVERARALEWSSALGTWALLDGSAHIEDPALAAPLPIRTLVRAAKADDAIAHALIVKRNPVIEASHREASERGRIEGIAEGIADGLARGRTEGLAQGLARGRTEGLEAGFAHGHTQGKQRGLAEAVLAALAARGLSPSTVDRARIEVADPDLLLRWIARASTCADIAALFHDG